MLWELYGRCKGGKAPVNYLPVVVLDTDGHSERKKANSRDSGAIPTPRHYESLTSQDLKKALRNWTSGVEKLGQAYHKTGYETKPPDLLSRIVLTTPSAPKVYKLASKLVGWSHASGAVKPSGAMPLSGKAFASLCGFLPLAAISLRIKRPVKGFMVNIASWAFSGMWHMASRLWFIRGLR